jgi:hypothetical protein
MLKSGSGSTHEQDHKKKKIHPLFQIILHSSLKYKTILRTTRELKKLVVELTLLTIVIVLHVYPLGERESVNVFIENLIYIAEKYVT